jgi:hypothetical protein
MGKGRGWHGDSARHAVASKKGWRSKSHDFLAPSLSARQVREMKSALRKLQKRLGILKAAKKQDSKKYEQTVNKAWEIFTELDKHGKL